MAIQNEPTRISIPFADAGTKNVIPDTNSTPSASQAASWTDGFPAQCSLPLSAGGIPPARADFNGILNAMTQSERFTQEGGVWAWDATVDYAANRVALGSDGKLYWSVAQSGPNVGGAHDPTTDNGTYWDVVPADDSALVHKAGTETISGAKTFLSTVVLDHSTDSTNRDDVVIDDDYQDISTAPSASRTHGMSVLRDKNDRTAGTVQCIFDQSGFIKTYLTARKWINNSYSTAELSVTCEPDGTKYANAPTPASAAENSTKIATTAWVRTATGDTNLNAADLASGSVLSAGKGGTGGTSLDGAGIVTKTGAQSISGVKTFTTDICIDASYSGILHKSTRIPTVASGQAPTIDAYSYLWRYGGSDLVGNDNTTVCCDMIGCKTTAKHTLMQYRAFDRVSNSGLFAYLEIRCAGSQNSDLTITAKGSLFPSTSSAFSCGKSGNRWSEVWAVNGTIQTSDERLKTSVQDIPDEVLDAWGECGFVQFQMKEAVEKKGESARMHSGLIAQQIEAAFKSHGVDARRYGFFCWDKLDAQPERLDEHGNVVDEARPAGDEFSLRYEEALCMEAAYQRRRADRAEARLAALEERLAALEARLA